MAAARCRGLLASETTFEAEFVRGLDVSAGAPIRSNSRERSCASANGSDARDGVSRRATI